jgi:type II secretory pathway pseudopilin PulG
MKDRMNKNFTLIDMVVIVGIIGIFFTMLFAMISSVRADAVIANCVNNLKIIGVAQASYSNDFDKWITPGNQGNHWETSWYRVLSGTAPKTGATKNYGVNYILPVPLNNSTSNLVCPAESLPITGNVKTGFIGTHYIGNAMVMGSPEWNTADNNFSGKFKKTTDIASPSDAIYCADSFAKDYATQIYWTALSFRHEGKDIRPNCFDMTESLATGKNNAVHLDGHVTSATFAERRDANGFADGIK